MSILAGIFVALAAILHGYIFLMESVWWTRPATWKRFNLASQADADSTRSLAYNQGFYNLFLGVGATIGLVLYFNGDETAAGAALILHDRRDGARGHRAHHDRAGLPAGGAHPGPLPLIGFVLFALAR